MLIPNGEEELYPRVWPAEIGLAATAVGAWVVAGLHVQAVSVAPACVHLCGTISARQAAAIALCGYHAERAILAVFEPLALERAFDHVRFAGECAPDAREFAALDCAARRIVLDHVDDICALADRLVEHGGSLDVVQLLCFGCARGLLTPRVDGLVALFDDNRATPVPIAAAPDTLRLTT